MGARADHGNRSPFGLRSEAQLEETVLPRKEAMRPRSPAPEHQDPIQIGVVEDRGVDLGRRRETRRDHRRRRTRPVEWDAPQAPTEHQELIADGVDDGPRAAAVGGQRVRQPDTVDGRITGDTGGTCACTGSIRPPGRNHEQREERREPKRPELHAPTMDSPSRRHKSLRMCSQPGPTGRRVRIGRHPWVVRPLPVKPCSTPTRHFPNVEPGIAPESKRSPGKGKWPCRRLVSVRAAPATGIADHTTPCIDPARGAP